MIAELVEEDDERQKANVEENDDNEYKKICERKKYDVTNYRRNNFMSGTFRTDLNQLNSYPTSDTF